MPNYIITGRLGTGKSLQAVGKIQDYLLEGRVVAANFDLNLEKLVGHNKKETKCFRLPDQPTPEDIKSVGLGSLRRGEENHGLLVLDEAALFLNTRDFSNKDRKDFINFIVHLRKMRWDVMILIQHLDILDKQIRNILGELIVYCRRWDRMKIPFLTFVTGLFGFPIRMPRIFEGVVKIGSQQSAPTSEVWRIRGTSIFECYNTEQMFDGDYEKGIYQLLPPYLSHGRYIKPRNYHKEFLEVIRNAKITTFRGFFFAGILAGMMGATLAFTQLSANDSTHNTYFDKKTGRSGGSSAMLDDPISELKDVYIDGYIKTDSFFEYFFSKSGRSFNPSNLGLTVVWVNDCRASIVNPSSRSQRFLTCRAQSLPDQDNVSKRAHPLDALQGQPASRDDGAG